MRGVVPEWGIRILNISGPTRTPMAGPKGGSAEKDKQAAAAAKKKADAEKKAAEDAKKKADAEEKKIKEQKKAAEDAAKERSAAEKDLEKAKKARERHRMTFPRRSQNTKTLLPELVN